MNTKQQSKSRAAQERETQLEYLQARVADLARGAIGWHRDPEFVTGSGGDGYTFAMDADSAMGRFMPAIVAAWPELGDRNDHSTHTVSIQDASTLCGQNIEEVTLQLYEWGCRWDGFEVAE